MRVVVAPDSFKGSLDAHGVARAIARGISHERPDVNVVECPLGDGGEGTLDVFDAVVDVDVIPTVAVVSLS